MYPDPNHNHNHCSMRRENGDCYCKLAVYTQNCQSCGRMVRLGDCIQHYQRGWGHTECQHSENEWGLEALERSYDDHGLHCSMRRENGNCYCKQADYSQHCQSCGRMVCPGDCIQHYQRGWGHTECQDSYGDEFGTEELLWKQLKGGMLIWLKVEALLRFISLESCQSCGWIWAQRCHFKPRTWMILYIHTFRDLHESQYKRQNQWRLNTTARLIQKTAVQKFQASSDSVVQAKHVRYTSPAQTHCHQIHSI